MVKVLIFAAMLIALRQIACANLLVGICAGMYALRELQQ